MKKTYHGSCHCGAVRFEADIDLEAGTGTLQLHDLHQEARLERLDQARRLPPARGQDQLADYKFNTKQGHHRFCRNCGVAAFGDGNVKEIGGAFVSISVACLDDVTPEQLDKLPIKYMDGRHDNWINPPAHTGYL